ncbi:dimethyl sulfoxide reductase anchor subunit [Xenorhabdus sp. 42]|uniref:dimethyl sulfoxide reductase anchor subunit family protein n=1 Tax=Xenorhabdus szentirmaii TaxID=290112 RepID=UPI0019BAA912|nr:MULTISPECIES: DmsC/YnfH family molybdoenzyme membrane anchor subunit [unclassified Xenorhabdus]MBD2791502.1 dimethyl sulfoxide reductase anchor subunit [Xenorhabdus sp. CUL]MBD2821815.1 dimethyl sulfoxide reductase anchor subunit [Xenorhabdus sp. 42]MBD2824656.1 dimethyl sulfoxide reductase anchor subunit [Xenorhabdus sp. 5]
MSEWLLVAFTMIVQSSVGLVLMSALYIYWLKYESKTWQHSVTILVQKTLLRTLLICCVLSGIGLVASLNVLGNPFNIYCTLHNVIQSWVNIETTFAAVYFGLIVLCTLVAALVKRVYVYAMLVTGIIGLIDLYYMALIYVNSAMITWTNINTYFLFYSAVFTLGPALALSFIACPLRKFIHGKLFIKLVISALFVVFISVTLRLIEHPAYMEWLAEITTVNERTIFPHQTELNIKSAFGLRMLSWCLYIIAMTIWIYALWKGRKGILKKKNHSILFGSFLMFIAELVNQYTFFIMYNV